MRQLVTSLKNLSLLPRGLYWRTFLIIALPLIFVQLVTAYVVYDRHIGTVTRMAGERIATNIGLCVNQAQGNPGAAVALAKAMGFRVAWSPGGKLRRTASSQSLDWTENVLNAALRAKVMAPYKISTHGTTKEDVIHVEVQLPQGVLRLAFLHKWLFSRTTPLVYMGTLGSTVVFMLLGLIFMRNQMRPIRRLAMAAECFGRGEHMPDIKPEGALEVRQAAKSFTVMKHRLTRFVQQRTAMLAAISHDLCTPLTRLKLQVTLMTAGKEKESLMEDIDHMQALIQAYLDFVRGDGEEKPVTTSLMDLVTSVAHGFNRQATLVTVAMAEEADVSTSLVTKPLALQRAVTNIIQNGLQHGTQVVVQVVKLKDYWRLDIHDNGPSLPDEEKKRVLRPFYRLDTARTIQHPAHVHGVGGAGAGLGLSIAQDLVTHLGGDITLLDSPLHGGLLVRITLP